jgi:hypothetical protein
MKIVQTFWSKPICYEYDAGMRGVKGGWTQTDYYFMSWAFSFYRLSQYYQNIELVTDEVGAEMLIQKLKLPYSNVKIVLDDLECYPPSLWALGKLYAYSIQDEPFFHVDSDVFIWNKLPLVLEQAPLVAQHKEFGYPFYSSLYQLVIQYFRDIPSSIEAYKSEKGSINAYNLGITGCKDTVFFKDYSKNAFRFLDHNLDKIGNVPLSEVNCFVEQVLFCADAYEKNIEVCCLLPDMDEDMLISMTQELEGFDKAPLKKDYIHLYGYCKKQDRYGKMLEKKLQEEFPDEYESRRNIFGQLI